MEEYVIHDDYVEKHEEAKADLMAGHSVTKDSQLEFKEDYIEESREITPTEVQNNHLLNRDDDLNQEINELVSTFCKRHPRAFEVTNQIIQNFILDGFDFDGTILKDVSCQTGTTISSVYGKLREMAYKNLMRVTKEFDTSVRLEAKIYFITVVDGEIFERVRNEAVNVYKQQLLEGKIPLPGEIKQFQPLINKYAIKDKLYQCIAEWYVEAEVSIDIVRRIYMYQIFEGKKNKKILDQLKKSWELKSNYYIDFESAFLSMICYLGTKLLTHLNSSIFELSKISIMMKVIYFIIFRSAVSVPILTTAPLLTLGTAFVSVGLSFIFNKISDYKKIREVELAFNDFKVITSNLIWDNRELQRLVLEACYREDKTFGYVETDHRKVYSIDSNPQNQHYSAADVIEARLKDMLAGHDKYRDGTIIKQFNSEDEKLKTLVIKDVDEEGFEDWIEVVLDPNESTKGSDNKHPIPPVL
eukprot:CAMPEP_0168337242 /NCGR_PEP_ID=MMETSP0213-20121227/12052_1 /TAXON_ID=151035 /ORGANISM="Euplotes harpa, Strain FSP1.4" /LENGTH=470 /DNA_ID=CAMNT_0008342651 /DNA_START=23 /DNA_END=1435 /DNA_ORIENTATION=+